MSYKVFFVEDEIITREGIRDNVDWQASGFEFCGEATDGEMRSVLIKLGYGFCAWLDKEGQPSASHEIDSIRNLGIPICFAS